MKSINTFRHKSTSGVSRMPIETVALVVGIVWIIGLIIPSPELVEWSSDALFAIGGAFLVQWLVGNFHAPHPGGQPLTDAEALISHPHVSAAESPQSPTSKTPIQRGHQGGRAGSHFGRLLKIGRAIK